MIGLKHIKEDIENIAKVISTVLNVDVTIVDEDLIRIAGTGHYKNKIGEKVSERSAFGISLSSGKNFIIENPREDNICNMCKIKDICNEYAEVSCAIKLDEKVYGVIGLIAFNEIQKNNIVQNKIKLMDFLTKMADLICSKIIGENKSYELKVETRKLQMLLNTMDKAVVSIDKYGKIDKWNEKFVEIFKLDSNLRSLNISSILSFIDINNLTDQKNSSSFTYSKQDYTFSGIYNANPIMIDNAIQGYVFYFVDNLSTIKDFNEITANEYGVKFSNIIGNSPLMRKVKTKANIASKSLSTVLITGESGTGKEIFARAIHNNSDRANNSFIAINCAAIPDALLESELFGYEEGAFTGAKKGGKVGKFELANNGTLFLDEIGDMSIHLQGKLLRILQEREVEKVGGSISIPVDVRIIAATNKDLEKMVRCGEFREDLYYRLNVIPINIPPLRERKEDIPDLLEYIISKYSNKLNKRIYKIDDIAMDKIFEYQWYGNVRELENVIEYSINMCSTGIIRYDDLPEKIKNNDKSFMYDNYEKITPLWELERREIIKALDKFKDFKKDKEKVADSLGISRATLYRKLKEYKIVSK
ncbi:sigma-54 interaction domain-containing protein [Alkalithermobacter paradoxus]|uniref:Nif-specific regulatory protein n=1 Tax=Alkalithermobacter paradoxus TaxID=29349 RepID=A0A1V4I9W2_9FIRM|nr:Nif-specific regulatory protein [[Clostridium] thermoalcaliphilum]